MVVLNEDIIYTLVLFRVYCVKVESTTISIIILLWQEQKSSNSSSSPPSPLGTFQQPLAAFFVLSPLRRSERGAGPRPEAPYAPRP